MKIIAGEFKGRRLTAPRGTTTRPTADQVRIALMDTLVPRLVGARLLDLFAGAGSVGLEALSRGAEHVTFVERDGRAVAALGRNVEMLGLGARAAILRDDALRAIARLGQAGMRFDLVFLDPPYEGEHGVRTVDALGGSPVVPPGAIVIAQHFTKTPPPALSGRLRAYRTRRFGETTLTFYESGDYDPGSRG